MRTPARYDARAALLWIVAAVAAAVLVWIDAGDAEEVGPGDAAAGTAADGAAAEPGDAGLVWLDVEDVEALFPRAPDAGPPP